MTVEYKGYNCTLEITRYLKPKNIAIALHSNEGPIAKATVNLEVKLKDGLVAIKDYAENEGMLQTMIDAGIVGNPVAIVDLSAYAQAHICPLLIEVQA